MCIKHALERKNSRLKHQAIWCVVLLSIFSSLNLQSSSYTQLAALHQSMQEGHIPYMQLYIFLKNYFINRKNKATLIFASWVWSFWAIDHQFHCPSAYRTPNCTLYFPVVRCSLSTSAAIYSMKPNVKVNMNSWLTLLLLHSPLYPAYYKLN